MQHLKSAITTLLATSVLLTLAACDNSSSTASDEPSSLSSSGAQAKSSDSASETEGSACGFSKADNVWKYSYPTWNYIDVYTWVDETTVEFKEYLNDYHMDKNDTTYTDVNRDDFYEKVLKDCRLHNHIEVEQSSDAEEIEQSSDTEVKELSSSSWSEAMESSNSAARLSYCKTESENGCEYGTVIDERDGNSYKTVKIGSQVWMAENLKFDSDSIKSECYGYQAENCEKYGRYYLWHTAIDRPEKECGHGDTCSLPQGNIQGVCMKGWHLPSKDEWETLLETVGGKLTAGKILKSQSGWYDDKNGVDAFGFSGVPGGRLQDNSYFDNKGFMGEFWSSSEYLGPFTSSTEYQNGGAYVMLLHYNDENAAITHELKYFGLNVRCVKD